MAKELSTSSCGSDKWTIGVAKDVTRAGGCKDIGLALPSLSLELVKLVRNKEGSMALYLGQPSTDKVGRMNSERLYNGDRSTAYTAKMVHCRDYIKEVTEPLKLVRRELSGSIGELGVSRLIFILSYVLRYLI